MRGKSSIPRRFTRSNFFACQSRRLTQQSGPVLSRHQLTSPSAASSRLNIALLRRASPLFTHSKRIRSQYWSSTAAERPWTKAYIALGSNQGDRLELIERACWTLRKHGSIRMLRTSLLYETKAMYVTEQNSFYNAACEIETCLAPIDLLDELQKIERGMGRVKTIDKGPRNIDLDILLYDGEIVDTERLIVPHKLMHEREFVLRPLADLIAHAPISSRHPTKSIKAYLAELGPSDPPLTPIVPFGPGQLLRPLDPSRRTKLMSILNVTPDSFSDGGQSVPENNTSGELEGRLEAARNAASIAEARTELASNKDMRALLRTIADAIADGSDIIDIGGQSTRPGAAPVTAVEELSRVTPAMAIRALFFPSVAASLDTYRSQVAARAGAVCFTHPLRPGGDAGSRTAGPGAHVINDISAGQLDLELLPAVAEMRATVVLMHMRGTPETMASVEHHSYPDGVVAGVADELKGRVAAAESAGIPRWRIVLDPGLGFAKNTEQNLELLENLQRLRDWEGLRGMPWLVGASRKSFVGRALGWADRAREERLRGLYPEEQSGSEMGDQMSHAIAPEVKIRPVGSRDLGTAATVAAAVQGGADVVRVHNVKVAKDVIAVADAIWRRPKSSII